MAVAADVDVVVEVDGHRIGLTNLAKPLYPDAGVRKADVVHYYAAVSAVLIPQLAGRPVTRKRWPDGVDAKPFFQKDLGAGIPDWVRRRPIEHRERVATYPIVDSVATLVWLAQLAALELHVPQWCFGRGGRQENPDRLVFDLDPGPGTTLADCAAVARAVRDVLGRHGSELVPVTSGSAGLHLYLGLNGAMTSAEAADWAHRLARQVERSMPERVVSRMSRRERAGRILIDWSQNNAAKTTVSPYSLRGRQRPTVAAPRTWEELEDPGLAQLDYRQVLDRLDDLGDPMSRIGRRSGSARRRAARDAAVGAVRAAVAAAKVELAADKVGGGAADPPTDADRLAAYRAKRTADRTPEPVPAGGAVPRGADDTFVIHEHHARRLHWDLRLERDGVLVSWAVPKGLPAEHRQKRLAVRTEDHPLEYATFAGTIPRGEYGAGGVTIWDAGRYRAEKWRDDEIVAVLCGQRVRGRYVLVRTGGDNWLLHLTKDQSGLGDGVAAATDRDPTGDGAADRGTVAAAADPAADPAGTGSSSARLPRDAAPMLAEPGTVRDLAGAGWRLEGKWDGIRAIVAVAGGTVAVRSRAGNDITASFPELAELAEPLAGHALLLDGEIVALDGNEAPSFRLLQRRTGLTRPREVRAAAAHVPAHFFAFDLLHLDGVSLLAKSYDDRRRLLAALRIRTDHCAVPAQLGGPPEDALAEARRHRWEGIVAKRAGSPYRPGRRSGDWVKVKLWATQDVVVVGWRPGAGRRAGGIGSLLLAIPAGADGPLGYVGRVGTGFADAELDRLLDQLRPLRRKTSPVAASVPAADARDAVWVTPKLVGEVRYSEVTGDGRLRQPSWRGLRTDVPVDQVRWDDHAPR